MADSRNQARKDDPQDQSMEEILQSIRRIIAEEGDPVASVETHAANDVASHESDILELTDIVPEEGADADADDILKSIDDALTHKIPETPPSPAAFVERAPAPVAAPPSMDEYDPDGLIADRTANVSVATVQQLVKTIAKPEPTYADTSPRLTGATTLEELTIEAMRPMLKDWLDANLPRVVETIVDREVRRITRNLSDLDD